MPATKDVDDGLQHYRSLGLPRTATQDEIKQAYRQLARTLHPDKGGNSQAFAALQAAFETLINPKTRAVYDALAADLRFRPGATAPYNTANQAPDQSPAPPPGVAEAVLLQQLLRTCGRSIDPARQLCVTCEVCRRPATKECWTCKMAICEFCTRRQHWKVSVPLHWPLVNVQGRMVEQLGKQEFELKRKEDALAYKQKQPGYRPQHEMHTLRQFQDAICKLLSNKQQPAATAISSSTPVFRSLKSTTHTAGSSEPAEAAAKAATAFALPSAGNAAHIKPSSSSSSSNAPGQLVPTNSSRQLTPNSSTTSSKALAVPGNHSAINRCLEAWRQASPDAIRRLQVTYDYRLARFYMWAQTEASVLLAVHMPTGGTSTPPKLNIEITPTAITLQHQSFGPAISRSWSQPVDSSQGVTSWSSADGMLVCMVVPKGQPGKTWNTCFKGDSHGGRCLQAPYSLLQLPHEIQLGVPLPFWVVPEEDLVVRITDDGITVVVDGVMRLERRYWKASRSGSIDKVINHAASNWCILEEQQQQQQPAKQPAAAGAAAPTQQTRPGKTLNISLALPELTLEEIQYKKGVRQNNAAATRSCTYGYNKTGHTFFTDDEDEFGLSPVLQALMFYEAGYSWVMPNPWEVASGAGGELGLGGKWVTVEGVLPSEVLKHLNWLRAAKESNVKHVMK